MPKNHVVRSAIAALLLPWAGAYAGFVGHPVTGAAIVTHGRFSNVYVYPNSDSETWDQHLAGLKSDVPPGKDFSRAHIDEFTAALMNGWPGYFDPLMQYRTIDETGISPPVFVGSRVASKACVDAALHDAVGGVVQWQTLRSLANCHIDGDDPTPQVNLIISPDILVASAASILGSGPDMCTGSTTAYHTWGVNVPNFTVIATNPRCNATFDAFTQAMSHEIVETLADPAGFGYLNGSPSPDNYEHGELGDICEKSQGARKNPDASPAIAFTTYQGYSVSRYWSDFDNACMPQMEGPPDTDSATWVLATGSPLARLTGATRDLAVPVNRSAPDAPVAQLRIVIQTGADDLRGGGGNDASVIVHLRNGDVQSTNINGSRRWDNGETHVALLSLPTPPPRAGDITGITIHKDYDGGLLDCCGDNWNIDKVALIVDTLRLPVVESISPGSGGCGVATPLVVTGRALDGATVVAVPDDLNHASIALPTTSVTSTTITTEPLPADMPPGVYEIVARTALGSSGQPALSARTDLFYVGPTLTSISPRSGPVAGGTAVTLTGACFDAPGLSQSRVQVTFGGQPAAKGFDQCASSTQCVVYSPPAQAASQVDIVVRVDGAPSPTHLADRFSYVGPFIARLTPNHGPKSGGTQVVIDGDGFPPFLGTGDNLPLAFGSVHTTALCLGSAVQATTSCMVTTPAVASAGAVQVIGTAYGTTTPATPATLFTFDEFPAIVAFSLPLPGVVAQTGVFLNGDAPAGGASVSITSDAPGVVRVPQDAIVVPAGAHWAPVQLELTPTARARQVTLTARYAGSARTATMAVAASPPLAILSPQDFVRDVPNTVSVSLNRPAPRSGATVLLSVSDASALALPSASVNIAGGAYAASRPLVSHYTGPGKWVDIHATYGKRAATQSVWVTGDGTPQTCKAKKCPSGFHWDGDQCGCVRGVPQ